MGDGKCWGEKEVFRDDVREVGCFRYGYLVFGSGTEKPSIDIVAALGQYLTRHRRQRSKTNRPRVLHSFAMPLLLLSLTNVTYCTSTFTLEIVIITSAEYLYGIVLVRQKYLCDTITIIADAATTRIILIHVYEYIQT